MELEHGKCILTFCISLSPLINFVFRVLIHPVNASISSIVSNLIRHSVLRVMVLKMKQDYSQKSERLIIRTRRLFPNQVLIHGGSPETTE